MQGIYDMHGEILGWEVLIDSRMMENKVRELVRTEIINDVSYSCSLLKRIVFNLTSSCHERKKFENKLLFINCEVLDLFESKFLDSLVVTNKVLLEMNIKLVIEITERKKHLVDEELLLILNEAKSRGLKFAADDYDMKGSDFRKYFVKCGLFEYIKVEYDDFNSQNKNNKFKGSQGTKFIVERVETKNQFGKLKSNPDIYGYQGYLFGSEESMGI